MTPTPPEIAAQLATCDDDGVWQSEGRHLFGVARAGEKVVVLAMKIGITEQFCGELLRGRKQPSIDVAARIFLVFKIPAHAWGMKPLASRESSTIAEESAESAA